MNCSNQNIVLWIIGIMTALILVTVLTYNIGGLPCGLGLLIIGTVLLGIMAGTQWGLKDEIRKYRECQGNEKVQCAVSWQTIDAMINVSFGLIGSFAFVGAAASAEECTIPIVGWVASVVTALGFSGVLIALISGTLLFFGILLWAIAEIHKCYSKA